MFELSEKKYSDQIKEDLKHIAESITYLQSGFNDSLLSDYKITAEELAL
ncbi:hypothetical protein [Candidatus Nitrosocosmicus franklandus]|nr:hypothetical protein [Candidatus Nitrosocosmicus franklandus]